MSLVNKMLRDLDARRAGEGERAALPAAVTPLAAHREPGSRLWWWLAALPVAAILGAAWFATQGEAPPCPRRRRQQRPARLRFLPSRPCA